MVFYLSKNHFFFNSFCLGKLVLIVKPNVAYGITEEYEEPPYQYVPVSETQRLGSTFEESMYLLADGLASGTLIHRYEMLYRKHPDMTCDVSMEPRNINKNRYRDILPCLYFILF